MLDASLAKIPLVGIIGEREYEGRTVAVREGGARRKVPLDPWALEVRERWSPPDFANAPTA